MRTVTKGSIDWNVITSRTTYIWFCKISYPCLDVMAAGGSWAKKERKKARHVRTLEIGHSDSKKAHLEGASPAMHPLSTAARPAAGTTDESEGMAKGGEGGQPVAGVGSADREDSGRLCISSCRTCKAEQGFPNGSAGGDLQLAFTNIYKQDLQGASSYSVELKRSLGIEKYATEREARPCFCCPCCSLNGYIAALWLTRCFW